MLPVFVLLMLAGCGTEKKDARFELLSPRQTNIHFENRVENSPEFNIINYLYFYDGGGIAAGDLNNNGLPDLFFVSNIGDHKLYENLGDFKFRDVTRNAGIFGEPGSWSTGVTMADVNGNGLLDIYISRVNYLGKSGRNQLFINNGDMTFTERAAEFGLDFEGYSTQAVFFDYNRNGHLDLFLLNHSFHSDKTYGRAEILRQEQDPKAGDRLFRNDGGFFTDVTLEAGIISSALGYGLGVAVTDINKNGWPDIYVGNDFHEDDYFYINNGDGTFTEMLYAMFRHTSRSSMGNDVADLTNDGYVDIVSLDMMPDDYETYMRSGGPDLFPIARTKRDFGFGEKNARNTVQVNRGLSPDGIPYFNEMAFSLGLAKTDWSWAALIADLDNSGFKDIFVTNGMPKRPNDLDFTARMRVIREQSDPDEIERLEYRAIGIMPETILPNYVFKNHGKLNFEDVTHEWGFERPSVSNGAVYVDLNNNGLLDIVTNNINERAFVYRNNTINEGDANFLKVRLRGSGMNTSGIGSKVILYKGGQQFYLEQMPTRGFQSSIDHNLHFGLGSIATLDSLLVVWPDWSYEVIPGIEANQQIELHQENASGEFDFSRLHRTYDNSFFVDVSDDAGVDFTHRENTFIDFNREPLLPYKLSRQGPALAVADVNGNGLDDFFIGGAHNQAGKLYLQQPNGTFMESQPELFGTDARAEDVDAIFFDATGNGSPDLLVVSGGGQFTGMEAVLLDRLYLNDGNGRFRKADGNLPRMYLNGAVASAADFNGNGHIDLFIGSRSTPWRYGHSPGSYILQNDGSGNFKNVTDELYPALVDIGLVTDALWEDITGDGRPELVIVGEWMEISVLAYRDGRMVDIASELGLAGMPGLWQSVRAADLTGNGHLDLIVGNFGTNSRIDASPEKPFYLLLNDFGDDGTDSAVIAFRRGNGNLYPFDRLEDLLLEFPFLTTRVRSYKDFATQDIHRLFGSEKVNGARKFALSSMESGIFYNNGRGGFTWSALPVEAQAFPVMASYVIETGSGYRDILLAGNINHVRPATGGMQAGGHGLHLRIDRNGKYGALNLQESGFFLDGEARKLQSVKLSGERRFFMAAMNDDRPRYFRLRNE